MGVNGVFKRNGIELSPISIRVPADLKMWMMRKAKSKKKSLNSEIVSMIKEYKEKDEENFRSV